MKTIFTLLLISFSLGIFSQEVVQADSRISTRFSDEYISKKLEVNPEGVRYMNYFLNNGYYITEMPGKLESLDFLYEINNQTKEVASEPVMVFDFDNINIYKYKYETGYRNNAIYRIGNTGKVLVFYSGKEMMEKYNKYKNAL